MTNSIGAIIASKNRRKIIRTFRNAGAVSPERAKSLGALGLVESTMFKIQKMRAVIVETDEKLFYLDEMREKKAARMRLMIVSISIVVIIILFFLSNSH